MRIAFLAVPFVATLATLEACIGDAPVAEPTKECTTKADCPQTGFSPEGCGSFECIPGAGGKNLCAAFAKDEDGDNERRTDCTLGANLQAAGYTLVETGHDCDDHDPNAKPGRATPCTDPSQLKGICKAGTHLCGNDGKFAACEGAVTAAAADTCGNGFDDNCDGKIDENCVCTNGNKQTCGAEGGADCKQHGTQTCVGTGWGACEGEKPPLGFACDKGTSYDGDCNGTADADEVACKCLDANNARVALGKEQGCTAEGKTCLGSQICQLETGGAAVTWGACTYPTEACGTTDLDCDGVAGNATGCFVNGARSCGKLLEPSTRLPTVYRCGTTPTYQLTPCSGPVTVSNGPIGSFFCGQSPPGWVALKVDATCIGTCCGARVSQLVISGDKCWAPPG